MFKLQAIIIIQSFIRGCLRRKKNNISDNFTNSILLDMLNSFINYTKNLKIINTKLNGKKIRLPNFPSEISENIVKILIYKKYKICPIWNTKSGDLIFNFNPIRKIEVKAFSSTGPSSFGPNENWDIIYFIDCKDYENYNFRVYEIKLSNQNKKFYDIKINKNETYKQQCLQKRRPRINFSELQKQLNDDCKLIFDNSLHSLL